MKYPSLSTALCLWGLSACFSLQYGPGQGEPAAPAQTPALETQATETTPHPTPQVQAQAVEEQRETPLRCFFEGQRFLDEDALLDALEFELEAWQEGNSIDVVADDCAYQLTQHYRALGFGSAAAFAEPGQDAAGSLITFAIQEGPQTLVSDFDVPGWAPSQGVSIDKLKALYSTAKQAPLVQRHLLGLSRKVRNFYRSLGFLDATAEVATIEPLPDQSTEFERFVRIMVPLQPGAQYMLAGVHHDLATELADRIGMRDAIDSAQSTLNAPFLPSQVPKWVRAADSTLTGAGYLDANIQASVIKDEGEAEVTVNLHIQPGQQVLLGSIVYPTGLQVRQSFLDRQVGLRPGKPLSAKIMDDALANLYRTGLFRTVHMQVRGSGPERDLVIELEEWPTRETFIEPGYGSFERARLRVGWRHHNVLGVGRSLRIEGVLAENASRALLGWSDPWTLGSDWVLDLNADVAQRKLPAFTRYSSAAGVFASRSLGDYNRWTVHTGARFEEIRLNDVRVTHLMGTEIEDDLSITTLETGLAYDNRNHPLLPSDGQKAHLTVQQTLDVSGSANAFAKVLGGWSYYIPLSESRVLSLGARGIAVFPNGGAPHPLGLRLFSGGNNSVRSFKESELGPLDGDGTPLGGEASSTFSIELNQQLGASSFQAAAFVDVGNVVPTARDLFEFDDLETALGVGLRYLLPIGPMRLDWAHNPNAGEFQNDWVLHFSVGVAF
ncbi:MAG: BamA/TamA family outer membrane protein [bacterium]|nr:BamA/TamA family outer membrane protein [bacterium]